MRIRWLADEQEERKEKRTRSVPPLARQERNARKDFVTAIPFPLIPLSLAVTKEKRKINCSRIRQQADEAMAEVPLSGAGASTT